MSRREMLRRAGKTAAASVALTPVIQSAIASRALAAEDAPLNGIAGIDRVTVLPGKTYLRGWAGYGDPPRPVRAGRGAPPPPPPATGPATTATWSKDSGPGAVTFADPKALVTTATFTTPGAYVLKLTVDNGQTTASSTLNVSVETPPPTKQLDAVYTKNFKIDSPLWNARAKALMVSWIPYCVDQMNRTDIPAGRGDGGIDNFVEAGKALRGEPHGNHKGYVFSNAWVHQTVEAMSIALMIDPQGDPEILKAHEKMRATLEDWIPKILAAQEPDGYLQTAFSLPRAGGRGGVVDTSSFKHWDPAHRGDHEGYTAGYFLESAINHYLMTNKKDARLYNAAKKLADCWSNNLGPAPKKPWYDGHQQMEQGLVRFGRFVNDMESGGRGQKYIDLARFLLDCRYTAAVNPDRDRSEYDQSHLPVVQQYEAVGHAVRAVYTYSGMADVAVETHDPDYQSAVKSLWDNLINKKYYVTGGVGSGETSEGFGPNYSLRNGAYCEACSTCGEIFFQWKMNLAYHDARYVDLYEESMYNALMGATDLAGRNFYYRNPLDERSPRSPWDVCPCCVGNISRTLLMLPTWVYAKSADGVYVNLFIGSTITVENAGGTDVQMVQATDYPWNGKVSITVNPKAHKTFSVRIRVPNRNVSRLYQGTPDANGITSLAVNGSPVKPTIDKGYAVITRAWKAGDRIDLVLPLKVQRVKADEKIESTRNKVALRYGPLVYNFEKADQEITDKALSPGSALTTEWKGDLLGGVMVIKGKFADGSPMMAIPNYARTNREPAPAPVAAGTPLRPATSVVWIKEA
ncbi:MAG: glycoside hydrolase family 127 protein [Acidobacteriia bacterium]|nr:glycoside hydrolase family 127 protein [Terriglobia bacterium]